VLAIPERCRPFSHEVTIADRGNFDELVSAVARLAASGPRKTEYVSEVQGHPSDRARQSMCLK
jgi:hypothetical protein